MFALEKWNDHFPKSLEAQTLCSYEQYHHDEVDSPKTHDNHCRPALLSKNKETRLDDVTDDEESSWKLATEWRSSMVQLEHFSVDKNLFICAFSFWFNLRLEIVRLIACLGSLSVFGQEHRLADCLHKKERNENSEEKN